MLASGVGNLFLNSVRKPLANQMKKEPVRLSENVDPSDPVPLPPPPPPPNCSPVLGEGKEDSATAVSIWEGPVQRGLQTGSCLRERRIVFVFFTFHFKVLTPSEPTGDFKQTTLPSGLLLEGGDLLFTPPPHECSQQN